MSQCLIARWVYPVAAAPIQDGAVLVEGDRIRWVGPLKVYRGGGEEILDLGNATLMPGLVNAHCHLEFGKSPQPPACPSFTHWARENHSSQSPSAEIIQSVLRGGSTTVANHCSPETDYFETPFRLINFWEVLGSGRERARQSFEQALERAEQFGGHVTPHSLYAVHRDMLHNPSQPPLTLRGGDRTPPLKIRGGWGELWSLHLLESCDENQFFREGRGPLADLVKERGGEIPFQDTSPIHWLRQQHLLGPQTLVVHGNYLQPDEIQWLQTTGSNVIHCPGSHKFFGHRRFPYEALKNASVPVALGTDSLASNEDLSMLREMRLFHESYPAVAMDEILKMATLHGAKALGLDTEIGSIEAGKKADLVAISSSDVLSVREASFVMIDGKRVL